MTDSKIVETVGTDIIQDTTPTQKIILALQHLIAMFGATVLVPILTGLDISVALFCAGMGTLIFHLCTKKKVPVFLGSLFAFVPVIVVAGEFTSSYFIISHYFT